MRLAVRCPRAIAFVGVHPSEILVKRVHGPRPVLLPWRPGAGYDRLDGTRLPVYAFFDADGTRRGLFSLEVRGADVVHLHLIRADEPGHKHGSRFIQSLCDEADSLAVTMDLEAAPQDDE